MEYESIFTQSFKKCLEKHRDKKKRIKALVDKILANPKYRSHLLQKKDGIDLRGKRSRQLAGDFTLVYTICDECINLGLREKGYNRCINCNGKSVKRIIFLAFGTHKDVYRREWAGELETSTS